MAQAFLETDFLVRRASPAPVRNTAQTGSRPAFTLDDPKPDPAEAPSPSRDTRSQAQRTERDRPDATVQPDRNNQARTERPAATAQSRSDAPAAKAKAAMRAEAASSDDTRVQAGAVRRDRPDTPAPTTPQASSEVIDAGTAQVEASLSATDETEDETDVSEAPVQDQDASLLALGLLPAPPPIASKAPSAPGQASASLKQGLAGQIQGRAARASSTDQAPASSGAVQAQKGVVSAATGQDTVSASDIDGTDVALGLQAADSTQPAGTAPPPKDAASGVGDAGILAQPGASDAVASDPTQLGQAVPATSGAQPSKDEPAAALQAILAAPGLSEAARSGSKPAGPSVAAKGAVQLTAGAGLAPKGGLAGAAEQEVTLAPSGAATAGKPEASPSGKSDPAVAVQEAAGGKDAAVSVAALPMPDAPQHQVQDSFSAHLAGGSIGPATTPTAGASAPTAPAAHTAPPASPPVPLGAVPMTIGLRSLQGSNHFEIRLDPGELGRIDVKLDIDKERGTVMAHLVVDRIETLALLQRDAGSLQQALSQAGLEANEANINLSLRSDAQSNGRGAENQGSDGRSPEGRSGHAGASNQPEGRAGLDAIPMRTLTGLTGLDIRI